MPYHKVGEVTESRSNDLIEEAERLKNQVPDNQRIIDDYGGHEVAESLADSVDDEHRVVFDFNDDGYYIEAFVESDE